MRFITFLVAFAVYYGCLYVLIVYSHSAELNRDSEAYALGYYLSFGSLYAVPTLLVTAIADLLAPFFFPRRPILGFVLLCVLSAAAGIAFLYYGLGYPLWTPGGQALLVLFAIPTLAVIAFYVVVNAWRKLAPPRRKDRNGESALL